MCADTSMKNNDTESRRPSPRKTSCVRLYERLQGSGSEFQAGLMGGGPAEPQGPRRH